MSTYNLAKATWKTIKETNYEVAVLPWGATEAHNYHLPYATDNYQCDYIAEIAAKKAWDKGARVIILPTIPYGVNTGQADIKLDMNITPSTQLIILKDLAEVLNRQGIKKLLVLNGHGGNDFRPLLRELGYVFPEMFITLCNWYQVVDWNDYFDEPGDHAGEMETSVMMNAAPHLVKPLSEAGDGHEKNSRIKAIREGWAWAERKWSQVTNDTGIGDPAKSTKEKGEKYVEAVTDNLANLFYELSEVDINNLYD